MTFPRNKFGVPHRVYRLTLADSPANTGTTGILPVAGSSYTVDIGCEEDWGDIQPMLPTDYPAAYPADWSRRVGFGNDADGHIEILCATDLATGRTYRDIHSWATHRVTVRNGGDVSVWNECREIIV